MPGDPLFLGIDTSTPRGGIALASDGVVRAEVNFDGFVSPSRRLLASIHFALETTGLTLADLAGLAVTVGPGSFTGIRVGLATARGLALATGMPVVGVSTLVALAAAAAGGDEQVAAWLDAGRGEVYAGSYRRADATASIPTLIGGECVARPPAVLEQLPGEPVHFVGSGALRHAADIRARPRASSQDCVESRVPFLAASTALLGEIAHRAGTALPPDPRYLRAPDALRARG